MQNTLLSVMKVYNERPSIVLSREVNDLSRGCHGNEREKRAQKASPSARICSVKRSLIYAGNIVSSVSFLPQIIAEAQNHERVLGAPLIQLIQ